MGKRGEKKSAKFWAPFPSGPPPFGAPTLGCPALGGPPPFPSGPPLFLGLAPPSGPSDCETTKTLILAKFGLAKNWSNKDGQNGLAKNGLSRCTRPIWHDSGTPPRIGGFRPRHGSFCQFRWACEPGVCPQRRFGRVPIWSRYCPSKADGGIRGIVVGDIIRRLIARTIAQQISQLNPRQTVVSVDRSGVTKRHVARVRRHDWWRTSPPFRATLLF